jgi:hypothetical protein
MVGRRARIVASRRLFREPIHDNGVGRGLRASSADVASSPAGTASGAADLLAGELVRSQRVRGSRADRIGGTRARAKDAFRSLPPARTGQRVRVSKRYGISGRRLVGSVNLDVRRPDHLAPLLGFASDEHAEVRGRAGKRRGAEVIEPRFDLGIAKAGINLFVGNYSPLST